MDNDERMEEVETDVIEVIGPMSAMFNRHKALFCNGRRSGGCNFQEDFEPILERQNHHLINQARV